MNSRSTNCLQKTKPWLLVLTLLSFGNTLALAAADPFKNARQVFKETYARATTVVTDEKDDSEALRSYPLYPYLQAARIKRALGEATNELGPADQRAETFVTYYEREPVGRDLRGTWLASLAQRKQWQPFLQHYRDEWAGDSLRCHSFTARIATGQTQDLELDIARQWLTPSRLPDCEQAFEWMRARNSLTPALIEQRVRRALDNNNPSFAKEIAVSLPPDRAAPLLRWAALLENPQKQIDALIASSSLEIEPKAQLAGWTRLARVDRDGALRRYESFVRARGLTAETASPYALALALALSWDRRPEALTYFKRVAPGDFDDSAREWYARAALWAGDWKLVSNIIAAMPDEQRSLARWRYWAARATEKNGDRKIARQLYESVLPDDNFYSIMSSARLDRPVAPHQQQLPLDQSEVERIEQLPPMVRARELLLVDMQSQAASEWRFGFAQLAEPARSQAIHLAARWGWYDQAIATASQQRVFYDYQLLYPQPYDAEVLSAAKLTGLKPQLIYSVMRQESLYRPDALSSAGARGLLQMLPETARRTARKWNRPRPSPTDLFNPVINVPLGAANLRSLVDRFSGQTLVALAGYNAGPNAAARWLPSESLDPDIWVENIPYNETRNYVQRILWHNVVFSWLKTGEPQKVDAWLARIAPLGEAAAMLGAKEDGT
ncbi:lytic transglycosylase domain-containing protein [Steroidobacter gossypii]|uniref:lytic transglycosylase domain-containing protein n=1 Tax=Steroidobacter gossypii TaxID=2805490 RepID=UPI001C3F6F59|nr:lytic transglycosylase domain-containing protein [Steroidobacter gossypii]